MLLTLKDFNL